jgi:hypothetical protein
MRFKSLDEAIESVTNPQPEFTQEEYIELLESALESIAEELECDVDDLVEDMAQTPQRKRQLLSKINKAQSKQSAIYNSPDMKRAIRSTK